MYLAQITTLTSIGQKLEFTGMQICKLLEKMQVLILQAPITTAADNIHKYFFIVFQRK